MPDSSPNSAVPGAPMSREASAQAAAVDGAGVLPDDGFAEAARSYARQVAAGPTVAHAATKQLVHTAVRQGARAADELVPTISGALFGTADLRGAVASFLADGPGKATYSGR